MATKAEQFHAEEQRLAQKAKSAKRAKIAKATKESKPSARAAAATRSSKKKRDKRVKPDATQNRIEEQRKGSPDARFRKANARASKVRGS
jgi:hypothetical protein